MSSWWGERVSLPGKKKTMTSSPAPRKPNRPKHVVEAEKAQIAADRLRRQQEREVKGLKKPGPRPKAEPAQPSRPLGGPKSALLRLPGRDLEETLALAGLLK